MSGSIFSQTGSVQAVQEEGKNYAKLDEKAVDAVLLKKAESEACEREIIALQSAKKKDSIVIEGQRNALDAQAKVISTKNIYNAKATGALKTCEDLNREYSEENKKLNKQLGYLGGTLGVLILVTATILITN